MKDSKMILLSHHFYTFKVTQTSEDIGFELMGNFNILQVKFGLIFKKIFLQQRVNCAGILHSVSDQIQNLLNCFTTPNKMTSEDDIKGLLSLKFLRPW